jgi:hypothetical protein
MRPSSPPATDGPCSYHRNASRPADCLLQIAVNKMQMDIFTVDYSVLVTTAYFA